jgi:adenylate kinase
MKKVICLYGMPASGKTTQAELIAKEYQFIQFGMGDHLRAEIESNSNLGKEIKPYVEQGGLIPDELMSQVIQKVQLQKEDKGIIFDGFPRMLAQAKMLDQVMINMGLEMVGFFYLQIDQDTAEKRISARAGIEGRGDDKDPVAVANRINAFKKESIPLIDYYKEKNLFHEVDGNLSIEQVYQEIKKHL